MKNETKLTLILSACVALCGCFDSDEVLPPDETEDGAEGDTGGGLDVLADLPAEAMPELWGPCALNADETLADGWGCEGTPGWGLACLRGTIVDEADVFVASLCVPQTAELGADCGGIEGLDGWDVAPIGPYCVLPCDAGACPADMVCHEATGACLLPE